MIGNDIIDLNVAGVHSRWQEKRFLNKLFTAEEQVLIESDNYRFQNIWRLWSMKESAYKIYSRKLKSSLFNPKSFNCKITSKSTGSVSFNNQTIHTTTDCNSDIIYTTAHLQNTLRITEHIELQKTSQSEKSLLLREKAVQAFAKLKFASVKDISIEKDDFGVPQFLINQKAQDNFLTLTHHGNYGGFAISS